MASKSRQLTLYDYRCRTGHGGPRLGAGRKPARRPIVHQVRRERLSGPTAGMITVRVQDGIPSLRRRPFIEEIRASFAVACERGSFRLVHYSILRDHLHLIVEADDHDALGRGMNSVSARIARAVNRVFRRQGRVLAGRYHVRLLTSPRQVRNALQYVLLNSRKHWKARTGEARPVCLDGASSGRFFDGWLGGRRGERTGPRDVAEAKTWVLRVGWRRHGLIAPAAVPGQR